MIVCVCHRVSDRDIRKAAQDGLEFADIQWQLGVATQCGQCRGCAEDIIDSCQRAAMCGMDCGNQAIAFIDANAWRNEAYSPALSA